MSVGRTSWIFIYGGMRDRNMRSGTKLAREIQLTDWSTAGNLSYRSSEVQIPRDICTRFGRYLYSTRCSWIIKLRYLRPSVIYSVLCDRILQRACCCSCMFYRTQIRNEPITSRVYYPHIMQYQVINLIIFTWPNLGAVNTWSYTMVGFGVILGSFSLPVSFSSTISCQTANHGSTNLGLVSRKSR